MRRKSGNIGFGNLTGLRPINTNNTTTTTTTSTTKDDNDSDDNNTKTNQYTDINTKIMKITLSIFERRKEHSIRNYNIETHDTIIKDLLVCYDDKHNNNNTRWF